MIREIFYDNFGKARPNRAHEVLARLEVEGWPRGAGLDGRGDSGMSERGRPASDGTDGRGHLRALITQNIDNLHRGAGIPGCPVVAELRR